MATQTASGNAAASSWDWVRTLIARGSAELQPQHLRRQSTLAQPPQLHCIVLDCSASMLRSGALAQAKGLLLALMQQAYQQRQHIALLCFGGQGVQLRLPPQRPPAWSQDWIAPIPGGGGTPLALAVAQADQLLHRHAGRNGPAGHSLWLLSDGRSQSLPQRPAHAQQLVLIDCERARIRLGRMRTLAEQWQAHYQLLPGA
ncbi:magnesium chelatase [Vandammella animalimorsus]|uniref:Magnesium chelatase n=1 Tax=Vandammella animalimorsus TaxID=2029117 RepID=A0A2A2A5T8_9BURK|nr:magnesium chelatase [Vandammella animalimorsus]